jgi:hypothetical protein
VAKELFVLYGAVFTGLVGFLAARLTSGVQLKIARENSDKDLRLQSDRLLDERVRSEISLERKKLEKLHKTLSIISFENSQTMSYIQSSDTELADFRNRYIENCARLHDALAITDLYYPEMSESIREIFGQSNIFWGYQEGVIRIDIKENEQGWQANLIAERGKELNKALQRISR